MSGANIIPRSILFQITVATLLALVGCGDNAGADGVGDGEPREGYPSGPYGTSENAIIADLELVNPDGSPFHLSDIYADGHNRLLLISTSAGWCTACIEEQPSLVALHEQWASQGLVILVALFEDSEFNPADADLAAQWSQQHDLPFSVVADPDFVLEDYYDSSLTPMNMFVEIDTMKMLKITTGWDQSLVDAIIEARL